MVQQDKKDKLDEALGKIGIMERETFDRIVAPALRGLRFPVKDVGNDLRKAAAAVSYCAEQYDSLAHNLHELAAQLFELAAEPARKEIEGE
jgi:hypothetical protein